MIKGTETIYRFVKDINLLSPKSDKHQFSPNNINTQSREKVLELMKKSSKGNTLIAYSSARNLPSGEERGETDFFAG